MSRCRWFVTPSFWIAAALLAQAARAEDAVIVNITGPLTGKVGDRVTYDVELINNSGRNLEKLGLKAQDTAELSFDNVVVPKENLLGEEGQGFIYLMQNLPQERISIATIAVAAIEHVVDLTLDYAKTREAFGKPIGKFQNTRFEIAEMATEAYIARVFVNHCIERLNAGDVDTALASMAKWWTTELQKKIVDQGLQLHGGYGYMLEYPIAKAYADTRIQTIYGGTTEIQKEIIGRFLGL